MNATAPTPTIEWHYLPHLPPIENEHDPTGRWASGPLLFMLKPGTEAARSWAAAVRHPIFAGIYAEHLQDDGSVLKLFTDECETFADFTPEDVLCWWRIALP